METRFLRFGRTKKAKSTVAELSPGLQGLPYELTLPEGRSPIFLHQPLGKSTREVKKLDEQDLMLLKGVAYESMSTGTTPQFGPQPHKGNGPVKLQTSRRLSSGELFATSKDGQPTLEDIRKGEYIVGRKDRRETTSTSLSIRDRRTLPSSGKPGLAVRTRPSTASPRTASDASWSWSPIRAAFPTRTALTGSNLTTVVGQGPSSPLANSTLAPSEQQDNNSSSSRPPSPEATPKYEPNSTIAALWKAESGRLVQLYGQAAVDRDSSKGEGSPRPRTVSSLSSSPSSAKPITVLDSITQPARDVARLNRSSEVSARSATCSDNISDVTSSHRQSTSSSWAASPVSTAATSVVDGESPATRESIRRVIEEMRSNYLQVIESQSPPALKKRSSKRRQKSRLGASPDLENDRINRQTWHAPHNAATETGDGIPKRRATSHPVRVVAGLSPIEATSSRNRSPASTTRLHGLKRADSMTLGGLMEQFPTAPGKIDTSTDDPVPSNRPVTPSQTELEDWLTLTLATETDLSAFADSEDTQNTTGRCVHSKPVAPAKPSKRTTSNSQLSKCQVIPEKFGSLSTISPKPLISSARPVNFI